MEDSTLWFGLAAAVAVMIIGLSIFLKKSMDSSRGSSGGQELQRTATGAGRPATAAPGRGNRRAAATAARNRRTANAQLFDDSDDDSPQPPQPQPGRAQAAAQPDDSEDENDDRTPFDSKLGAKKRAKLEAKEEKRQQRETEDRLRAERKVKEAKEEDERKKRDEQEQEDEKRQIEEAKRLRAEELQREQEEYLQMRAAFTVEEEGCDVNDDDEEQNLLEKFIEHIKEKKVILFEELATNFNLKVPDAINRLNTLVTEGRLTGVMDDRGKFIYISEEELSKFAKFIKQRGRVSISDLVENSSSIINITSDTKSAPPVEV